MTLFPFSLSKNDGVTLIEILVSLAIFAIVLAVGYSLFSFGARSYERSVDSLDIQGAMRLQGLSINREIRNAVAIRSNMAPGHLEINLQYINDLSSINGIHSAGVTF